MTDEFGHTIGGGGGNRTHATEPCGVDGPLQGADAQGESGSPEAATQPGVGTGLVPRCAHCCKLPAFCFGTGEGQPVSYACDECCGHGNEDGWCVPLSEAPEKYNRLEQLYTSLGAAHDRLHARCDRYEAELAILRQLETGARVGFVGEMGRALRKLDAFRGEAGAPSPRITVRS